MANQEHLTPDRSKLYHYKLDLILGKGGAGTVYRGIDTQKGEVVAVKRFHESFFRNPLHLRDVKKSIKRFRKFEHNNVVRIFDFLDDDEEDGNCMIMEYVDGPNLRWYITNRPWNMRERLTICAQMCNGLQYLHDQGVIHHDFKPANVLFTRRGIAKIADYSLYGSSLILELFDKGAGEQITPMFVAPELVRREKPTKSVDLYSLGIVMYMLFADQLPFAVDSIQRLYQCHLRLVPNHPSDINENCPRDLGDIIMKLLAKHPEKRFKDCDELRIALADIGRSRI